jgi:predicted metal-dependent hydrolase
MEDTSNRGPLAASSPPWNGTVVRSRFFDAISLLLPAAETFMNESMGQWLEHAGDTLAPPMRAEVKRFIREENAHQKVHHRYNDALLAQTPSAAGLAERASSAVQGLSSMDWRTKMALSAALEYLTSLLSQEMLLRGHLLSATPTMQSRIWRWHAREELAHSHIALDAAASLRLGAWRLGWTYLAATFWLCSDVLRHCAALCRCDRAAGVEGAGRLQLWADAGRFMVRSLPTLVRLTGGWLRYFLPWRPSFARAPHVAPQAD